MKKLLLLSLIFISGSIVSKAQSNLDFETWTGNEPDGWITYNFLSQFGTPQSTFKETSDPGESAASAKMVTVNCALCPNFGLPATLGGAVTLGILGPPTAIGVAYTGRPTSIDFQYKANPVAGDAGLVFVQLSRWDGSQQVVVGQGYFLADAIVSSWTSMNIPIGYANSDVPDTLMILSTSSASSAVQGLPNGGTPAVGSEFYVDSIVINDPCAGSLLAVSVTGTNETVLGANDGTATAVASGYAGLLKTVQVSSNIFTPNTFNAAVGDTVEWVWVSGSHTTTSLTVPTGAATWDSPMNSGNTSFKYPVTVAGNYTYECTPHSPSMAGNFTASSPYSFVWNNSSTTETISGLAPGTYTVVVADPNGCLASGTFTVAAGPDPCANSTIAVSVTGTNESASGANDGTATVTVTGSGYSGQIKTVQVSSNVFTPNAFNATVGDTVEWVWMAGSHTTTSTSVPTGAATWDSPMNSNNTSFKYPVTMAGNYTYKCTPHAGSGMVAGFTAANPYSLSWSNTATTETISGLAPGTYAVTVTDSDGCTAANSYTVLAGPGGINPISSENNISVFPNPAKNNISFRISSDNAERILIYDITGKLIQTVRVSNKVVTLSLENISEGIYFYQVKNTESGNLNNGKFSVVR